MSRFGIIRLGYTPDDPVFWGVFDGVNTLAMGPAQSLEQVAVIFDEHDEALPVTAIIRGEDVAYRAMASPPRQRSKLNAAAMLLLEDELATSIDDHHVVVSRTSNDDAEIYAVFRSVMVEWREALSAANITLRQLVPDFCIMNADAPTVFVDRNSVIGALNGHRFATDPNLASKLIKDYIEQDDVKTIDLYREHTNTLSKTTESLRYVGDASDETFLRLAATAIDAGDITSLLTQEFRPARKAIGIDVKWKRPAILAGGLAASWLAMIIADGFFQARSANQYEAGAQEIHLAAFPDTPVNQIRNNARTILSGSSGASFSELSTLIGDAIETNPTVGIDRIRFDAARNRVSFSVRSESDQDIDAFRRAIEEKNIRVLDDGGYRRAGAYWVGDLAAEVSS